MLKKKRKEKGKNTNNKRVRTFSMKKTIKLLRLHFNDRLQLLLRLQLLKCCLLLAMAFFSGQCVYTHCYLRAIYLKFALHILTVMLSPNKHIISIWFYRMQFFQLVLHALHVLEKGNERKRIIEMCSNVIGLIKIW